MAPLRYAANFDPFLSLDCAKSVGGRWAQSKERKESNFAVWQPCLRKLQFTDTDRYFCRIIGTEGLDHPTNVTSTYLFARDESNLLDVYIPFEFWNVMQGRCSVP